MYEKFIKKDGVKPGPTSIILAGVHGDEKCGIEAFKKILPRFKIQRGRVWFGYGNPRAIKEKKRFTETNLNRMFKSDISVSEKHSYEYKRAQLLKKYLNKADVLLDIHASYTPKSKRFIICEKNAKEIVKYLPFGLVVSGFDRIEPGGTDYYMNSIGKIGICIECDYLKSSISTKIAIKSIYAFLAARDHIDSEVKKYSQSQITVYRLYMTKTNSFKLSRKYKDFDKVKRSEIIGIDGKKEIRSSKNSIILFASDRYKKNMEAFLLGTKTRTRRNEHAG